VHPEAVKMVRAQERAVMPENKLAPEGMEVFLTSMEASRGHKPMNQPVIQIDVLRSAVNRKTIGREEGRHEGDVEWTNCDRRYFTT